MRRAGLPSSPVHIRRPGSEVGRSGGFSRLAETANGGISVDLRPPCPSLVGTSRPRSRCVVPAEVHRRVASLIALSRSDVLIDGMRAAATGALSTSPGNGLPRGAGPLRCELPSVRPAGRRSSPPSSISGSVRYDHREVRAWIRVLTGFSEGSLDGVGAKNQGSIRGPEPGGQPDRREDES